MKTRIQPFSKNAILPSVRVFPVVVLFLALLPAARAEVGQTNVISVNTATNLQIIGNSGSSNVWSVGPNVTLLFTNSGGFQLGSGGNNNTLYVTNAGAVLSDFGGGQTLVGQAAGANNALVVAGGGVVSLTNSSSGAYSLVIGNAAGSSSNSVTVSGQSSKLTVVTNSIALGNSASFNTLVISNGGGVLAGVNALGGSPGLYIGVGSKLNASNVVVVTGQGSYLSNGSAVWIGTGTVTSMWNRLTVSDLARVVVTNAVYLAENSGNTGGGSFGRLEVLNGAQLFASNAATSVSLRVGSVNASNNAIVVAGVVNGTNATFRAAGDSYFGEAAGGNFNTVTVSNGGRLLLDRMFFASAAVTGSVMQVDGAGSQVILSSALILNSTAGGASNQVLVSNGGLLQAAQLKIVNNEAMSFISNSGGIFQFASSTPSITGTYGRIAINGGTISYIGIADADVRGSLGNNPLTNMFFAGNNTFRLDGASNFSGNAQNYTFGYTSANPSNYGGLEMINGNAAWRSAWLAISNNGTMLVSSATATVAGVFTNSGTVRVINSTVTWQSNVVISGQYFSDPSTNIFGTNATVTSSGYLQGSNGDLFVFYRNFLNQSTVNTNFSLWKAAVLFTNGAGTSNHTYDVTGSGSANWGTGFTNFDRVSTNFGIGTLSIAPGNRLMITGQVGGGITNAVYVGWLDIQGLTGSSTGSYANVSNTLVAALSLPDINLYYDITDHRNDWLTQVIPSAGYNLWSGGLLLPIPEPSASLLVAVGVGMLAWLRRKAA